MLCLVKHVELNSYIALNIDPLHKWRLHLNNNTYTSLQYRSEET